MEPKDLRIEFMKEITAPDAPSMERAEFGHQAVYHPLDWKLVAGGDLVRLDFDGARIFIPMQRINSLTEVH